MKNFNDIKALSSSFFKEEMQIKQDQRDSEEKNRQADIDYEKRSLQLQGKEKEVIQEKIAIYKEEEIAILQAIGDTANPVNISITGNEDIDADRYVELKDKIPDLEKTRDKTRAESLTKTQIITAEFAITVFFIFILTRLAAENIDLLESFIFISTFQDLYGFSKMTLYADMVLQDYPIVLAISYITAITFKNNDAFYSQKLKVRMFYSFGFFISGLFISSMLFSY